MKKSIAVMLMGLFVMPVLCAAGELTIAGSTTVQKRIVEPGAAALKAATGVAVKFQGTGTGKGLLALIDGSVTVSAASESLADAIVSAKNQARELSRTVNVPTELKFHGLYIDNIVVIVNKDNPVRELSMAQLKDLHTGKTKNWKEVGGPDLPVKVVTSHAGSATRQVFRKEVMDGADYMAGVVEVRTTRDELHEVAKDSGAIGAVSQGFVDLNPNLAKVVKAPLISRGLGLITVGTPQADVQKVIDFFRSPEGKKLIQ